MENSKNDILSEINLSPEVAIQRNILYLIGERLKELRHQHARDRLKKDEKARQEREEDALIMRKLLEEQEKIAKRRKSRELEDMKREKKGFNKRPIKKVIFKRKKRKKKVKKKSSKQKQKIKKPIVLLKRKPKPSPKRPLQKKVKKKKKIVAPKRTFKRSQSAPKRRENSQNPESGFVSLIKRKKVKSAQKEIDKLKVYISDKQRDNKRIELEIEILDCKKKELETEIRILYEYIKLKEKSMDKNEVKRIFLNINQKNEVIKSMREQINEKKKNFEKNKIDIEKYEKRINFLKLKRYKKRKGLRDRVSSFGTVIGRSLDREIFDDFLQSKDDNSNKHIVDEIMMEDSEYL